MSVRFITPGIAVALFFQCMIALLNPTNRTKHGTKWGLMVHTATMFSIVTLTTGMGLNSHSRSYIDNRGFPGNEEIPPGPLGYKILSASKATSVVPNVTPLVNQWLADGFLVRSVSVSATWVSNVGHSSSIAVTLFTA